MSKHVHDFVTCKCGCCGVDGGTMYLRRTFTNSMDDFTELSVVEENNDIYKKVPNAIT